MLFRARVREVGAKMNTFKTALAAGLFAAIGSVASAASFSFYNITGNNVADATAGEAQLSFTVSDCGGNCAYLTFMNSGPLAMSITDVYFEDNNNPGEISSISGLVDADDGVGGDAGVDFSLGAAPPNLPGGGGGVFTATAGLLADSDPPVQPNGVNPGEQLGVFLSLVSGNYLSLISDLEGGDVRVGIHVQGFSGGGSESFINNRCPVNNPNCFPPVNQIPVPASLPLLLAGLGVTGFIARRKRETA